MQVTMKEKDEKSGESLPLYLKIKRYIQARIDSGDWRTGSKISSEAELGAMFKSSRMTVNRAVRELTSEGKLVRKQGQGTFVAKEKPQAALFELNSIADEINTAGGKHSCVVHLLTEEKASPFVAEQFDLAPYAAVYHSLIVHCDNNVPIMLADRMVNPLVAPDYLKQDFTTTTVTEYLLRQSPVTSVEHVVEALIPDAWIRNLLQINESEPCLALRRRTWSGQRVATRSIFYYPGSRYTLGGRFTTKGALNGQVA